MKKLLAMILTAVLSMSLIACGNKGTDGNQNVNEDNSVVEDGINNEDMVGVTEDVTTEENTTEETTTEEGNTDSAADTIGQMLKTVFLNTVEENADATALEIADTLLAQDMIQFAGTSMEVEPGLLSGFNNTEITGFSEGAMFAPMIGSIPFVGYIFVLEDGADTAQFVQTLEENADPRWNICTEADETVVEAAGNKVFFVMCPASFDNN